MKKRIALASAPLIAAAVLLGGATPAQAATGCVYSSGAWYCQGTLPPTNVIQKPVKRIPERQAQAAYVRAQAVKLIQQRIAARHALLAQR